MLTEEFTKLLREFLSSKIFDGRSLSLFDSFNENINKLKMSFNNSCEAQFVLYMLMFQVNILLKSETSTHNESKFVSLLSVFSRVVAQERLKWSPEEQKREQVRREWYLEHNYEISQELDTAGFPPSLLYEWHTVICQRQADCRSLWLIISAKVIKQYLQKYYYCVQQLELWLEWRRLKITRIIEDEFKSQISQPSLPFASVPQEEVCALKRKNNLFEFSHLTREHQEEHEHHEECKEEIMHEHPKKEEKEYINYNDQYKNNTINIAESVVLSAVLDEHLFLLELNTNVSELSRLHAEDQELERRNDISNFTFTMQTTTTDGNSAKTIAELDQEPEINRNNVSVASSDETISSWRVGAARRTQTLSDTYSEIGTEGELRSARSVRDERENIFNNVSQIHVIQNVMERWRTADHNTTLLSINYFFALIDADEFSINSSEVMYAFINYIRSVIEYNPLPVRVTDEYKNSQKEQLFEFAEHWATSKLYRTLFMHGTHVKEKRSNNDTITLNLYQQQQQQHQEQQQQQQQQQQHMEAGEELHDIADNSVINNMNTISYDDSTSNSSSDNESSSNDEFDIFATQIGANESNESSDNDMHYEMHRSQITYRHNNHPEIRNNSFRLQEMMRINENKNRENTNIQSQKWRQICSDPFAVPYHSELINLVNKTDIREISSETLSYESALALAWEFMSEPWNMKTKFKLLVKEFIPMMTLSDILPCDWPSDRTEFMKGDIHLSTHLSSDEQNLVSECLEIHLREIDCSLYKEVQEWMCKECNSKLSEDEIEQKKRSNWRRLIEERSVFNVNCKDRQAAIITLASLYGGVLTLELINPQQISGNPAFGIQCDTCCVGKVKASFQAVLENGVRSEIMIMPQFLGFDMCVACAYYYYKSSCIRLLRALHPSLPERCPFVHGLNCEMVIWHMEVELSYQELQEELEEQKEKPFLLQVENDEENNVTDHNHKTSHDVHEWLSLPNAKTDNSEEKVSSSFCKRQIGHTKCKVKEEGNAKSWSKVNNDNDDDNDDERGGGGDECTSCIGSDTHRVCTLKVKMCVGVSPINAQPVAWHIPRYKLEKLKQVLELNNVEESEIEETTNANNERKENEFIDVKTRKACAQSSKEATVKPCSCEDEGNSHNNCSIKINKRLLSSLPVPPPEWAAHCTVTRSTITKSDEEETQEEEEKVSLLSCKEQEKYKETNHADENSTLYNNNDSANENIAEQLFLYEINADAVAVSSQQSITQSTSICKQGKDANDKNKKSSSKMNKRPLFSKDDCCSICLLPLAGPTPTLQTRCKHWFHAKCIIEVYNRRKYRKEIDNDLLSNTSSLTPSFSSSHEMTNSSAANDSNEGNDFSTSDGTDDWLSEDDTDETTPRQRRQRNVTVRRTEQRGHRRVATSGEGCPVCRCDDYMPHDINQVDAVIRKNVYDVTLSIQLPQSSLVNKKMHMHREQNKRVMCPPQTVAIGTFLSDDALFHNPTNMSSCELREVQLGYLSSSEVVSSSKKSNKL